MASERSLAPRVSGFVRTDARGEAHVAVVVRAADTGERVETRTDSRGWFEVAHPFADDAGLELLVEGAPAGAIPLPRGGTVHEVDVGLPADDRADRVRLGGRRVDAGRIARLREGGHAVLNGALREHGFGDDASAGDRARLLARILAPLPSDDLLEARGCQAPLQRWAEAVATEEAEWLGEWLGSLSPPRVAPGTTAEHVCGSFHLHVDPVGPRPDPWVSRTPITLPGSAAVLGHTDPHGPSNYVQRVCFWLSLARDRFLSAGFREPNGGGTIHVMLTGCYSGGYARNGWIWINPGLPEDELAPLLVHEYMHLVQEAYEPAAEGPWHLGREGGSVLAEELVIPAANTHIAFANQQSGILAAPWLPLGEGSDPFSLFLHYLAEQHPKRGTWVYRRWLEIFAAGGNDPVHLGPALQDLWPVPPAAGVRHVGTAWPADDTLLGNFWLACALKDLHPAAPDPRFGFSCNAEFGLLARGRRYARLRPVHLVGDRYVRRGATFTQGGTVRAYAADFFRLELSASVDEVRVALSTVGGFARPLLQVAVVESGHRVREVVRASDASWIETFPSEQDGIRIHHLWIVVAAAAVGGAYHLHVTAA